MFYYQKNNVSKNYAFITFGKRYKKSINTFNLRTPKDFKRYLSLLPEYREIIMGKFSYDKAQAWYMLAINAFKNN